MCPMIIENGAEWFAGDRYRKESAPRFLPYREARSIPKLIEVPMGTTLREVIYDIGGGIKDERESRPYRSADRQADV